MFRTKLADRQLPDYTRGEELFNMITHIVGGGFGIVCLMACVIISSWHRDVLSIFASFIYGGSMILLYTMSSVYHGLIDEEPKKVFQVLDHCTIYLLISGTYTPIILCVLLPMSKTIGWTLFGIIWGLSLIGIALNSVDLKRFKVISMILYLGIGWSVVFTFPLLKSELSGNWTDLLGGSTGLGLLVGGGIAYTVGSILYGIGKKKRYAHSVFHIFVLLGSILHFFFIALFVI